MTITTTKLHPHHPSLRSGDLMILIPQKGNMQFKVKLKSSTLVTIVTSYGRKITVGVVAQWGIIEL